MGTVTIVYMSAQPPVPRTLHYMYIFYALRSLPSLGYSVKNPCGIHAIHHEFHMESME